MTKYALIKELVQNFSIIDLTKIDEIVSTTPPKTLREKTNGIL